MSKTNNFNQDQKYVKSMVDKLNGLLSDVQLFYMNARGFHWNIKGNQFFMLHEKFEKLYDTLADNADEIAERILMLEGAPLHAFSDYIKKSDIKEIKNVSTGQETVKHVVDGINMLLEKEREISSLAGDAGDDATVDLVTGMIAAQEKDLWMYRSFLK
ncbi:MAG: DNA starvation/stationary phase protection protein [Bacteroidales bacterium]|nr:DNA starvation/stationary phase protection protein [Bacteroidales bacterium]